MLTSKSCLVLLGEDGEGGLRGGPGAIVIDRAGAGRTPPLPNGRRDGRGDADAPVSGGVRSALTAELASWSGRRQGCAGSRSVLRAMGKSVIRAGGIGSGQAMKALNNLVSAGGFLIAIEALLVGKKFGLDPAVMVDILNASTGMNNSTQVKLKQFVLSGSYGSGFALELMVKDIGIALDVAKDLEVRTPFAALCRNIWSAAQADLGAGHDHTELAKFAAKVAGVNLA
jgi:3-hydroxyisobutyrate dehydrogenase